MRSPLAYLSFAVLTLLVSALPVRAQGTVSEDTTNFVEKAAVSNTFEIRSSEIALDRSQNEAIRDFARRMITDHTMVKQNMTDTLQAAGIALHNPESLDEKHLEKVRTLQSTGRGQFDRQYIDMQMEAHEEAVSLFEEYAENGDNEQVRQFAAQTLPALQQHKDQVDQLDRNLVAGR